MLCLSNGSAARNPSRKDKHPFEDNPFFEGFLGWKDSPKGQQSSDALDLVFDALGHVDVDTGLRKIVWTDGPRLSIEEIVDRIHAEHADMPRDVIETQVFRWLENCAPESYSERQMEEFDPLTGAVAPRLRAHAMGRRILAENAALLRKEN